MITDILGFDPLAESMESHRRLIDGTEILTFDNGFF